VYNSPYSTPPPVSSYDAPAAPVQNVPTQSGFNPFASGSNNTSGIISGVGDIGSIIGGLIQNNAQNKSLGALSGDLSGILSSQTGLSQEMVQQYLSEVAPQLQSTYGTASQNSATSLGQAGGYATGAQGAATNLQNNPYVGAQLGASGQLANFSGLTQPEMNQLTTTAGDAARSSAATMASQIGGVANPAALEQELAGQAGAASSGAAVQLGANASAQKLQAQEAALGGYQTAGSQYLQGQSGAGGLMSNLSSQYAGLSESQLQAALSALSTQSQEAYTGMQGLTSAGQEVGSVLNNQTNAAANSGGGMSSVMSGIGGLASVASMFG
jgi:hypothetical protein